MTHESQPVALVTGASSGIGKATANLLAINGFRVFGSSRRPDANLQLPYSLLSLDVRSDDSVHEALQHILQQAGWIDVLINNAGYAQAGAIEENRFAEIQLQLDTNLFGVLRVTNAVLPSMRRQRRGRIINVGSLVGQVAPPYLGIYASSKFALEGLSEALRGALRPFQIYVSLLEPGFVKTNLADEGPAHPLAEYEQRRQMGMAFVRQGVEQGLDPSLVAHTILHIATTPRPRLRYPIGRVATLLITLKRLLPEPAFEWMRRRAFRAEDLRLRLSQMPSGSKS